MKKIFNRVFLSKKELEDLNRFYFQDGFHKGMRLASVGVLSAIHRIKKLDTWDNDLKKEIIEILEIVYDKRN